MPGGARIAYTVHGAGPPLVLVPGWLCHADVLWRHPAPAAVRARLTMHHRLVCYDRLGCGLSSRDALSPSLAGEVEQLIAVMNAAGIKRAHVVGLSLGGPPAAALAARHPGRVARLVLHGTFARGSAVPVSAQHPELRTLLRTDWSLGARLLAAMLLPDGTAADLRWFADAQRRALSAETAARLLEGVATTDVTEWLPDVRAPTLVLHERGDEVVPLTAAEEIAALVPGAQLQVLEGHGHDLLFRAPMETVDSMLDFISGGTAAAHAPRPRANGLSAREHEVLRLVAAGLANKTIASELGIAVSTVERHLSNVYCKLDARGRADATMRAVARGLVSPGGAPGV